MKTWRWGVAAGAIASALVLGTASCGDDDDDGAAAPRQVDPDPVRLEIVSATVPDFANTAARPTVTFRVLDGAGNPIDVQAELATTTAFPRLASPGRAPTFTVAMLDDNGDYVSYYSTTRAPDARPYTYVPDPDVTGTTVTEDQIKAAKAPAARTQATSAGVTASNITVVGTRTYQFTFPAAAFSTNGMDRTKTHRVAGWVVRRPNAADSDIAHDEFDFVPAGGTPRRDEVITDAGCNRCHGELTAHGTRRGVGFCLTCHSPQTGDPETNQTVDFKVMIHKIHYGSDLPSVRRGEADAPYFIVGNNLSVHDWSTVAFPWHDHGVQHCSVCHTGADGENWRTKPTMAACTSCHDNVKFGTPDTPTAGLDPCLSGTTTRSDENCIHSGGLLPTANPNSPTACLGCHGPGTIAAVDRFHHGG